MAERFSEFDATKASEALGTEARATRDVAHGDGQAIDVGETSLEVYPDTGVARITTTDAQIELFRVPTYNVSPQRVVFQQGEPGARTRLLIRNDGRVWYYPGLRAPESARNNETTPSSEMVSSTPPDAPTATTTAPDNASVTDPEQQEPVQLQLTGRLGRDPWFNDQGEQPTAGFPLAVNEEGGKTTWHRVIVFGDVAEQVRTGLQKGQIKRGRLVQLTGTQHVQTESTAKGGTRTTSEFHATSVVRINPAAQQPPVR